jgi:hypothetical protein
MEKTHFKKLRNPNYIGSYELMTGTDEYSKLIVQIKSSSKDMVQNGDKKEEAMVITLENQKPMICNSTNAKSISKALGSPFIEDWTGKFITLYAKKIKAFGEWQYALRVEDTIPELSPAHPKWNGAIQALKEKKITVDKICQLYTVSAENKKILESC